MTMAKSNHWIWKIEDVLYFQKWCFVFIAMLVYLEGETHDNPQLAVFMS